MNTNKFLNVISLVTLIVYTVDQFTGMFMLMPILGMIFWVLLFFATCVYVTLLYKYGQKVTSYSLLTLIFVLSVIEFTNLNHLTRGELTTSNDDSSVLIKTNNYMVTVKHQDDNKINSTLIDLQGEDSKSTIELNKKIGKFVVERVHLSNSSNESQNNQSTKVSLGIVNEMFNQSVDLSSEKPETTLGPIYFKLLGKNVHSPASMSKNAEKSLIIIDTETLKPIKSVSLSDFKKEVEVDGVGIELIKSYEHATIIDNKIQEGGVKGRNPALELRVKKGSTEFREVTYSQHENFSLNKEPTFGLRFRYIYEGKDHSNLAEAPNLPQGNAITIRPLNSFEVEAKLYKDQNMILERTIPLNTNILTPWMNIQLELRALSFSNQTSTNESGPVFDVVSTSMNNRTSFQLIDTQKEKIDTGENVYDIQISSQKVSVPFVAVKSDKGLSITDILRGSSHILEDKLKLNNILFKNKDKDTTEVFLKPIPNLLYAYLLLISLAALELFYIRKIYENPKT